MFSNTLEGNIIKYNLYKIFIKRTYLPLIIIYLTIIGKVSLQQLGIIASITAIVSLVMEIPAGYIADTLGHKKVLMFGSFLMSLSPLFYIFLPSFIGGILASVIYFSGASFISGSIQAFIHETLRALGKDGDYVKIMGKAQSYGLLGNIVLISLIPLTYSINPLLPFILGFICLFISFLLVVSFKEPGIHIKNTHEEVSFFKEVKNTLSRKTILKMTLVFIIFGIVGSALDNIIMYRELLFKDFGIPIYFYGFILAFGSLLAAIAGRYIQHLKKLKPNQFYFFDIVYMVGMFIIIGLSKNMIMSIFAFSLVAMYDRNRSIIFESRIFEEFPKSNYKSTLLSIMSFFALGNSIWIPLIFAYVVLLFGISKGYILFGGILFIILIIILIIHNTIKNKNTP